MPGPLEAASAAASVPCPSGAPDTGGPVSASRPPSTRPASCGAAGSTPVSSSAIGLVGAVGTSSAPTARGTHMPSSGAGTQKPALCSAGAHAPASASDSALTEVATAATVRATATRRTGDQPTLMLTQRSVLTMIGSGMTSAVLLHGEVGDPGDRQACTSSGSGADFRFSLARPKPLASFPFRKNVCVNSV